MRGDVAVCCQHTALAQAERVASNAVRQGHRRLKVAVKKVAKPTWEGGCARIPRGHEKGQVVLGHRMLAAEGNRVLDVVKEVDNLVLIVPRVVR